MKQPMYIQINPNNINVTERIAKNTEIRKIVKTRETK